MRTIFRAEQSRAEQSRAEQSRAYDLLRVIATILVVIGHCTYFKISTRYGGCDYSYLFINKSYSFKILNKLTEFIYIFHMPLFIALSGALFEKSLSKGNYSLFIRLLKKKSENLLIPFGVVTVFYAVPIKFISGYFNQSKRIVRDILVGQILIQGNTYLWYLLTLYAIFIIAYFIERTIKIKQTILLLFLIILSIVSGKIDIKLVSYICQFGLWFYVGMLFEEYRIFFEKKFVSNKKMLFRADIILLIIYTIFSYNLISFPAKVVFSILKIILAGLLCLTTYMIAYFASESWIMELKIFNIFRRDSFGIYLYSDPLNYTILMIGATLFGGKIWSNDIYSISFYLFRFFFTLGISILVTELLRKCKVKYIC